MLGRAASVLCGSAKHLSRDLVDVLDVDVCDILVFKVDHDVVWVAGGHPNELFGVHLAEPKVWLLAMAVDGSNHEQVDEWAANVGEHLGSAVTAVDRSVEGAPILQREALRREAELPDYAIALMFDDHDVAQHALNELGIVANDSRLFRRSQAFLAQELRII